MTEELKELMRGPRLNMGQAEELRPYSESSWDIMDPQGTKGMMNLGLEWDQIQDSIHRRYDRVMAMFLIPRAET